MTPVVDARQRVLARKTVGLGARVLEIAVGHLDAVEATPGPDVLHHCNVPVLILPTVS